MSSVFLLEIVTDRLIVMTQEVFAGQKSIVSNRASSD